MILGDGYEFYVPVWINKKGEREQGLPKTTFSQAERILQKRADAKMGDQEHYVVKITEEVTKVEIKEKNNE